MKVDTARRSFFAFSSAHEPRDRAGGGGGSINSIQSPTPASSIAGAFTREENAKNDRRAVYKPSELQAFLKEKGVHAKKGLSQNFLIDGNIVQKIVATARVEPGDFIVEIGPGPGALTQALLEKGAHVLAVEMDTLFADALTRLQTSDSRLKVACADILAFPLQDALGKQGNKKAKIVANLPYHITTPILALLLPLHTLVDSLTIMVQKEFADRMAASPKTPEYSSFTVFLQFYASLDKSFAVSPHCFFPKPTVHSAVVHCTLHPPLLENGAEGFFQMTRTAFGQRRKMLRSSLKDLFRAENIEHALAHIGHPGTARPEELRIDEFISLYVALKRNRLLPQPESPLSP